MSEEPFTYITANDVEQAFRAVQREILAMETPKSYHLRWKRMATLLNAKVAYCVHRCSLPFFEEGANDFPPGYGIEHSADGGFYPYEINLADVRQIAHLKDRQGLDRRCASRQEAVAILVEEVEK